MSTRNSEYESKYTLQVANKLRKEGLPNLDIRTFKSARDALVGIFMKGRGRYDSVYGAGQHWRYVYPNSAQELEGARKLLKKDYAINLEQDKIEHVKVLAHMDSHQLNLSLESPAKRKDYAKWNFQLFLDQSCGNESAGWGFDCSIPRYRTKVFDIIFPYNNKLSIDKGKDIVLFFTDHLKNDGAKKPQILLTYDHPYRQPRKRKEIIYILKPKRRTSLMDNKYLRGLDGPSEELLSILSDLENKSFSKIDSSVSESRKTELWAKKEIPEEIGTLLQRYFDVRKQWSDSYDKRS